MGIKSLTHDILSSLPGSENGGSLHSETSENGGSPRTVMTVGGLHVLGWYSGGSERFTVGGHSAERKNTVREGARGSWLEVTTQREETLAVERGHTQIEETPTEDTMVVHGDGGQRRRSGRARTPKIGGESWRESERLLMVMEGGVWWDKRTKPSGILVSRHISCGGYKISSQWGLDQDCHLVWYSAELTIVLVFKYCICLMFSV
ncbi:hypothetical protein Fot_20825 [Forsythia ovata]|uniref:Uncharacterized protein n=1 Tax=Forsythia ovata TaxID=205694 RepID=A0ABD1UT50_9LAMI